VPWSFLSTPPSSASVRRKHAALQGTAASPLPPLRSSPGGRRRRCGSTHAAPVAFCRSTLSTSDGRDTAKTIDARRSLACILVTLEPGRVDEGEPHQTDEANFSRTALTRPSSQSWWPNSMGFGLKMGAKQPVSSASSGDGAIKWRRTFAARGQPRSCRAGSPGLGCGRGRRRDLLVTSRGVPPGTSRLRRSGPRARSAGRPCRRRLSRVRPTRSPAKAAGRGRTSRRRRCRPARGRGPKPAA
jgi:hypothetical protein